MGRVKVLFSDCLAMQQALRDALGKEKVDRWIELGWTRDDVMVELRVTEKWTQELIAQVSQVSRARVAQVTPGGLRYGYTQKEDVTGAMIEAALERAASSLEAWVGGILSRGWLASELGVSEYTRRQLFDGIGLGKFAVILRGGLGLVTEGEQRAWLERVRAEGTSFDAIANEWSAVFVPVDAMTVSRGAKELGIEN